MKIKPFLYLFSFLCVLVFAGMNVRQDQEKSTIGIVGTQAPSWDVESWHYLPEGKEKLNVTDYRGKVLYLYFFQSWCPGCHKIGFPTLQKLNETYANDKKVEFVVIQTTFEGHRTNTSAKLKPTAKKYGLEIPFAQSTGKPGTPKIIKAYRSGGTPWVVVIDKKGVVRFNDFHIKVDDAKKLIDSLK